MKRASVQSESPAELDSFTPEFAPESDVTVYPTLPKALVPQKETRRKYRLYAALIVGAVLISASAVVGLPEARPDASLSVDSDPAGQEVKVDGQVRGTTPLVIALPAGKYSVLVGSSKARDLTVAAGQQASMFHVLNPGVTEAAASAASSAALSVVTEPAGGMVTIDGQDHGAAPVIVRDLTAGEHRLVVRNQGAVYQQTVTLEGGSTATVVIGAAAGAAAGWLTVKAPLRLQIFEAGRLIGTTDTDRLMLPSGDHQLTFSDEASGYRVTRSARIVANDTTIVALQVPQAPVNVDATPWAEVWVDNERIGETPIGNYLLTLGNHQVELRHPQLGTKRVTMTVSLNGANRVAVNMRER